MTKKITHPILFYSKLGKEGIGVKSISKEEADKEKEEEEEGEEEEEEWEEKESRSSKNLTFSSTKTLNAPERVHAAPRLRHDVQDLLKLTESLTPPERHVQGNSRICVVHYGFVDASGGGFGASVELDNKIVFETGIYHDLD